MTKFICEMKIKNIHSIYPICNFFLKKNVLFSIRIFHYQMIVKMVKSCYPELGDTEKRLIILRIYWNTHTIHPCLDQFKKRFNAKNIQQCFTYISISERVPNQILPPQWWHVQTTWFSDLLKWFNKWCNLIKSNLNLEFLD